MKGYKILQFQGGAMGYRLIDDDNSFADVPKNSFDISAYNYLDTLDVKLYNERGKKVLRTEQEKYGVDKKFIIPAGNKMGIQWYRWNRPRFRHTVKKLSEVFSKSLAKVLGRPVYGFKNMTIDEEYASYEFWFRLGGDHDFDEPAWDYEDECNACRLAISNLLKKKNISFVAIECEHRTYDGWFGGTIYFDSY